MPDNVQFFSKHMVDPDSVSKDPRFSNDFCITVNVTKLCDNCNSSLALQDLCKMCTDTLLDELFYWQLISSILANHDYPSHEEAI